MSDFDKFYTKTDDECWIFKNPSGGTNFLMNHNGQRKNPRLFFFEEFVGPLFEEKIKFSSICKNKLCVNPEHIYVRDPEKECSYGHVGKMIRSGRVLSCSECSHQKRMEKKISLTCDVCGGIFNGNRVQENSQKNGKKITCSEQCRNKTAWVKKCK